MRPPTSPTRTTSEQPSTTVPAATGPGTTTGRTTATCRAGRRRIRRQQNRGGGDDDDGRLPPRPPVPDRRRRGERGGGEGGGNEPELREDDVVQPVAGILDVLDNYAFVRTWLPGRPGTMSRLDEHGPQERPARRGDAVTGAVRVAKEGDGGGQNSRQKFNPLVCLDSVNGGPVRRTPASAPSSAS